MTTAGGGWASPQLAEFLAALTSSPDETSALARGIERAAEVMEAELGAIVEAGRVTAAIGFPPGDVPENLIVDAVVHRADTMLVEGVGQCSVLIAPFESDTGGFMVLGRVGDEAFSREEATLLRVMGRILALALHVLNALDRERGLRAALEKRQVLLERLAGIQRSISRRAPLQQVLDAITSGARDLLDDEVSSLRLIDAENPSEMILVSSAGVPAETARRIRRSAVGSGATGRSVAEQRLVVIDDYATFDQAHPDLAEHGLAVVMAAPVRDGERVVGSIVVGSMRRRDRYDRIEQEILLAFAEHASLAITDAKTVDAMEHLAFHDALTGLPNRSLFFERLDQALARGRRDRTDVAVLYLDLDRFKTVNDSLGHGAGDQLLIAIGRRIVGALREADTVARLAGDEFAVLLEEHEGLVDPAAVAARILDAIAPPFDIDGAEVSMTASIGIAVSAEGAADSTAVVRNADLAMYRAKIDRSGGCFAFEPAMHEAAVHRLQLEADLRHAIERRELVVHYQPVVDLRTRRICAVEALLRWQHPVRGLVAPADFVPLAEDVGLIVPIGAWVVRESVRQVRRWQRDHPGAAAVGVSVNLSARQIRHAGLVGQIAEALAGEDFDPTLLTLEVTETALMSDTEAAARCLADLKQLGVRLALDDFGTGYSSLGHLIRFPIDCLKVDKSFIDGIAGNTEQSAVARAIIGLGRMLNLETIAEGIEQPAQLRALRDLDCTLGQGYLLWRPSPAHLLEPLLAEEDGVSRTAVPPRHLASA